MNKIAVSDEKFYNADSKTKVRYLKNDIKRMKRRLKILVNFSNRHCLKEIIFRCIRLTGYYKRAK